MLKRYDREVRTPVAHIYNPLQRPERKHAHSVNWVIAEPRQRQGKFVVTRHDRGRRGHLEQELRLETGERPSARTPRRTIRLQLHSNKTRTLLESTDTSFSPLVYINKSVRAWLEVAGITKPTSDNWVASAFLRAIREGNANLNVIRRLSCFFPLLSKRKDSRMGERKIT